MNSPGWASVYPLTMGKYTFRLPDQIVHTWDGSPVEVRERGGAVVLHFPSPPRTQTFDSLRLALREGWYQHCLYLQSIADDRFQSSVLKIVRGERLAHEPARWHSSRSGYKLHDDVRKRETRITWKYDKPRTGEKIASLHAEFVAAGIACRKTATTIVVPWPDGLPSRAEFFVAMDRAETDG